MIIVPDPVSYLMAVTTSSTAVNVSWNSSLATLSRPVWFNVIYSSITCYNQTNSIEVNETVNEVSIELLQQPGQDYNISITVSNPIGYSNVTTTIYKTPPQSL